jgi:hypothetical protein
MNTLIFRQTYLITVHHKNRLNHSSGQLLLHAPYAIAVRTVIVGVHYVGTGEGREMTLAGGVKRTEPIGPIGTGMVARNTISA